MEALLHLFEMTKKRIIGANDIACIKGSVYAVWY
jgi:hypothetical protein